MSGHTKPVHYEDWGSPDYLDGAQMQGAVRCRHENGDNLLAYADPDDGKRIVHALNNHDALLDALRAAEARILTLGGDGKDEAQATVLACIRAAIAKAEGR